MRTHNTILVATALLAVLASAPGALAAPSPADKCEAGKNDSAGKFASCIAKAQKTFVLNGDMGRYNSSVTKCEEKQAMSFTKLETTAGPGICPSEADNADVTDFISACLAAVAGEVAGGSLPADLTECYNDLATCESDFNTCDDDLGTCQADLDSCQINGSNGLLETGQTDCYDIDGDPQTCAGSGQDGEFQKGATNSYTDNGNGTVTDNRTNLMWEKLSDDGSIHDRDTLYTWVNSFTKAASLNSAVFAGHNDWRIPNIHELESINDYGRSGPSINPVFSTGCAAACTVTTCSCTRLGAYWSSTSYDTDPSCAWDVGFSQGERTAVLKTSTFAVRAVRGGS